MAPGLPASFDGSARKSTSEALTHGGSTEMPLRRASAANMRELVGVAHVERHGGGEELLAVVRLHVGRVIADQRVGGGVRFVEAVAGELVDQLEDVGGVVLLDAVLHGAGDEARLLAWPCSALSFLPMARRRMSAWPSDEAAHHLGDLNDLLLVDDDAVGLLEDRLQQRMQAVDRLLAVLAVDVGRDVVHRAGAIQRHHGDDVLEAVGLQPLQALAHARRLPAGTRRPCPPWRGARRPWGRRAAAPADRRRCRGRA